MAHSSFGHSPLVAAKFDYLYYAPPSGHCLYILLLHALSEVMITHKPISYRCWLIFLIGVRNMAAVGSSLEKRTRSSGGSVKPGRLRLIHWTAGTSDGLADSQNYANDCFLLWQYSDRPVLKGVRMVGLNLVMRISPVVLEKSYLVPFHRSCL